MVNGGFRSIPESNHRVCLKVKPYVLAAGQLNLQIERSVRKRPDLQAYDP